MQASGKSSSNRKQESGGNNNSKTKKRGREEKAPAKRRKIDVARDMEQVVEKLPFSDEKAKLDSLLEELIGMLTVERCFSEPKRFIMIQK